ncbi:hypothetical protein [Xanthomonas sacchari]|uniref:hypothetical protein n=1 Tax=Xanthomonas sacchari TaxID=56458 RepID=UPI0022525AA6|nr:hypothetical protein [Xanthomonas sacchari]
MPKTRVLTLHQSTNPADLELAKWCLAFFLGMPLTTTTAGLLDAVPTKLGSLVDFVLSRHCDEADIIELTFNYLNNARGDTRSLKRVAAVIHALFLSHSPQSVSCEQFQYLYMALDGCFKLVLAKGVAKSPRNHGDRIQWMCATFDVPAPDWSKNATSMPSSL